MGVDVNDARNPAGGTPTTSTPHRMKIRARVFGVSSADSRYSTRHHRCIDASFDTVRLFSLNQLLSYAIQYEYGGSSSLRRYCAVAETRSHVSTRDGLHQDCGGMVSLRAVSGSLREESPDDSGGVFSATPKYGSPASCG